MIQANIQVMKTGWTINAIIVMWMIKYGSVEMLAMLGKKSHSSALKTQTGLCSALKHQTDHSTATWTQTRNDPILLNQLEYQKVAGPSPNLKLIIKSLWKRIYLPGRRTQPRLWLHKFWFILVGFSITISSYGPRLLGKLVSIGELRSFSVITRLFTGSYF